LASIIIVHGLQGHPFKTWACTNAPEKAASKSGVINGSKRHSRVGSKGFFQRIIPRLSKNSSAKPMADCQSGPMGVEREGNVDCADAVVFWPGDLLPRVCPYSRILIYGYDTKVTKYMLGPPNKSSIFSHGKDLLYALARARALNRPLILIAHSLGGIVVKEVG
jgi:protein SERAC1